MSDTLWQLREIKRRLEEEIVRLRADIEGRDSDIAIAMRVLKPNMPESGLVDACKQVKQVAISEAGNAESLRASLHIQLDEGGRNACWSCPVCHNQTSANGSRGPDLLQHADDCAWAYPEGVP